MLLAAHALGYGACWVGTFKEEKVASIIGAPSGVRPLVMILIGRPTGRPKVPPRNPLSRVIHRNRF